MARRRASKSILTISNPDFANLLALFSEQAQEAAANPTESGAIQAVRLFTDMISQLSHDEHREITASWSAMNLEPETERAVFQATMGSVIARAVNGGKVTGYLVR